MSADRFRRDPVSGLTPLQGRILAVLVANDGMVSSDTGQAVAKLRSMASNADDLGSSSFRAAVRHLEQKGLVQRDLRATTRRLTNGAVTSTCHGVALAVEPSELPEIVAEVYLPEYQAWVASRATTAGAKTMEPRTMGSGPGPVPSKAQLAAAREDLTPLVSAADNTAASDEQIEALADQLLLRAVRAIETARTYEAHAEAQRNAIRQLSTDLGKANRALTARRSSGVEKKEIESLRRANDALVRTAAEQRRTIADQSNQIKSLNRQLNALRAAASGRAPALSVSAIERLISDDPTGRSTRS